MIIIIITLNYYLSSYKYLKVLKEKSESENGLKGNE